MIYARPKDVVDLERLLAVRTGMDLEYERTWIAKMVPAEDPRIAILDDLVRRFGS